MVDVWVRQLLIPSQKVSMVGRNMPESFQLIRILVLCITTKIIKQQLLKLSIFIKDISLLTYIEMLLKLQISMNKAKPLTICEYSTLKSLS